MFPPDPYIQTVKGLAIRQQIPFQTFKFLEMAAISMDSAVSGGREMYRKMEVCHSCEHVVIFL
jgi:hypothetical protein